MSAANGHYAAHANLGLLFSKGTVVAKNPEAALFHTAKAAALRPKEKRYQNILKDRRTHVSSKVRRDEIEKLARSTNAKTLAEDQGLAGKYHRD